MIEITPTIALDEQELEFQFVRASGPGGQHVNTSATAVQLRFDVANSPSLPAAVKARLLALAGARATADGVLILTSQAQRSQLQNREAVLTRLIALIERAAKPPRPRHKTRPPRAANEQRLRLKKQRSERKRTRGQRFDE